MHGLADGLLTTAFAAAVIVPTDVWISVDARTRQRAGEPVRLSVGGVEIEAPRVWLAWSIVLFVVAVPAYVVARRRA